MTDKDEEMLSLVENGTVDGFLLDVYRGMFLFDTFAPENLEIGVFIPNLITHGIIMQGINMDTQQCIMRNTYNYHYDIINYMQDHTSFLRKQTPIDDHIAQTIGTFSNQMIFVYTHIAGSLIFLFCYVIGRLVSCYQKRNIVAQGNSINNEMQQKQTISTSHT